MLEVVKVVASMREVVKVVAPMREVVEVVDPMREVIIVLEVEVFPTCVCSWGVHEYLISGQVYIH